MCSARPAGAEGQVAYRSALWYVRPTGASRSHCSRASSPGEEQHRCFPTAWLRGWGCFMLGRWVRHWLGWVCLEQIGARVRAGQAGGLGVAGRDGPNTPHGQGGSSPVSQRLVDLQTGFAHAPGAGQAPALVWKSFGQANAALTQSSARRHCRAPVCWLSGHRWTCPHAGVAAGRGQHGDGNRNV